MSVHCDINICRPHPAVQQSATRCFAGESDHFQAYIYAYRTRSLQEKKKDLCSLKHYAPVIVVAINVAKNFLRCCPSVAGESSVQHISGNETFL